MVYLQSTLRGIQLKDHLIADWPETVNAKDRDEKTAEMVNQFLDRNRVTSADIFIAISSKLTMVQEIEFPSAVKENLGESLYYEIEKYIPIPADNLYFDYQIIDEDKADRKIKILFVAVDREELKSLTQMLTIQGYGISGVEPANTALANYFSFDSETRQEKKLVFFWPENGHCELGLLSNHALKYCRVFDQKEAHDQQEGRSISEWLKTTQDKDKNGDSPIRLALFNSAKSHPVVRDIVENNIAEMVIAKGPLTESVSDKVMVAIGAALKGVRKIPMAINLLPVGLRKPRSRLALYVLLTLSILAVFSIVGWAGSWIAYHRHVINGLDSQLNRLKRDVAAVQQIQDKSLQIETRINQLNEIRKSRISTLIVLKEMSQRIPKTAWIERLIMKDDEFRFFGNAKAASELVSLLEDSKLFKEVRFLSAITISKDGMEKFQIGLKIVPQ